MDHTIKCDSKEVTAEVRKALQKVKPDYPVAKARLGIIESTVETAVLLGWTKDFGAADLEAAARTSDDPIWRMPLRLRWS